MEAPENPAAAYTPQNEAAAYTPQHAAAAYTAQHEAAAFHTPQPAAACAAEAADTAACTAAQLTPTAAYTPQAVAAVPAAAASAHTLQGASAASSSSLHRVLAFPTQMPQSNGDTSTCPPAPPSLSVSLTSPVAAAAAATATATAAAATATAAAATATAATATATAATAAAATAAAATEATATTTAAAATVMTAAEEEAIAALISVKETKKAANILLDKLKQPASSVAPHVYLQWQTIRLFCLLRLHEGQTALEEIEALGDLDASYWTFQHHPTLYPGKRGSLVPFSLRVLCALAPQLCGNSFEAISPLYGLVQHCKQQLAAVSMKETAAETAAETGGDRVLYGLWLARLIRAAFLLSLVLTECNYPQDALKVLKDEVLALQPQSVSALSLMGRIALKMGCTDCAEEYFTYADCVGGLSSATSNTNHGLLLLFNRRIPAAVDAFEAAVRAAGGPPGAPLSLGGPLSGGASQGAPQLGGPLGEAQGGPPIAGGPWETACQMYCPSAHAVCCNNSAVSEFYCKRLAHATTTLEGLIHSNPNAAFPAGVQNLQTLYEFSLNREACLSYLQDLLRPAAT